MRFERQQFGRRDDRWILPFARAWSDTTPGPHPGTLAKLGQRRTSDVPMENGMVSIDLAEASSLSSLR
jgi:hypothetical protein